MFAIIYRFELKSHQEAEYRKNWCKVSRYFMKECGALGSCLHKGADGLWVAYSRWPSKKMRDAAWPGKDSPNAAFPEEIREAIQNMQVIKGANEDLLHYDEICLDVVEDFLK